jgi:uncharacterized integral membrane protein
MRALKTLFLLLLGLVIVAFALLNAKSVPLNYLLGHIDLPFSLAMLICLSLGAFLGMLWTASWVINQHSQAHELRKKVTLLQKEIDNLRAMPVKDVDQWS